MKTLIILLSLMICEISLADESIKFKPGDEFIPMLDAPKSANLRTYENAYLEGRGKYLDYSVMGKKGHLCAHIKVLEHACKQVSYWRYEDEPESKNRYYCSQYYNPNLCDGFSMDEHTAGLVDNKFVKVNHLFDPMP